MQRLSQKFHFLIALLGIFFVTQTTYASEVGYEQHVLFTYGLSELELSVEGMGEAPGQKIVLSGEDISGLSVNNAELDYSLPETEVALFPKSSPERNDYEFWNIQGTYQGHLFLILGYEIAYDGDEDSFFQKNIGLLMDGAKILLLLMLFGILCFFFKRKSWLMALMCLVLTSCSTEYPIDDCYQTYSGNGISLNYPCTWKVLTEARSTHPVELSSANGNIYFYYPVESFEEFEETNKTHIEKGQISVKESQLLYNNDTHQARGYRQHGGSLTLIEMHGNFIGIWSEFELNQQEQKELDMTLNSIKFE